MAKMSLTPSKQSIDEFVQSAGKNETAFPWDDDKVREDIYKNVALRVPEPYAIKLQWISEQTGIPQQKILRDWLLPLIDGKVEELSR